AIEATPTVLVAEIVTVSAERPFASTTPQPSNTPILVKTATETAVATSTPTPTLFPSPTPIPPLLWSNDVNFVAHIEGISSNTVIWSPIQNELVATTCWEFNTNSQQIFRFVEPEFEKITITPQNFSCEVLDEIAWAPDGEKILHSDTFPENHPNHPSNYGYDNSAIWVMNRDGSDYQPINFDEAYGRYLVFSDWFDSEILVYKYYCGGGHDCVVKMNVETGQRLNTTVVHIGDGFQAGKNYVATNNGMLIDLNTTAVSIMDEIVHSEPFAAEAEYMLCLSNNCGALPCISSPCIDENSRFEDWLPNTNEMLVITWPAEEFLLLRDNFDQLLNPKANTQLQLWDVDAQELTLLVDKAIFGRFSPDGRFLAYQTLSPTPQMHIMDVQTHQTLHSFPTHTPTLELAITTSSSPYLWSPNSTQLIFRDPLGNLNVLTLANGLLTALSISGGERLRNPQWSYDGRYLSVSVQKEDGGETAVLTLITSSEEN
ncbi:MAG: hypothetical protein GY805_01720, partial [Chloroflexi bacterium]|nr:hypothetical protein [Chloroflexota bacterium]